MNKFLRAIKWKNRFGRWDKREIEADFLVFFAVAVVSTMIIIFYMGTFI